MEGMRPRLRAPVLVGVGAAFDFHAGRVSQAPGWMQRRGLEWRTACPASRAVWPPLPPRQPGVRRRLRPPVARRAALAAGARAPSEDQHAGEHDEPAEEQRDPGSRLGLRRCRRAWRRRHRHGGRGRARRSVCCFARAEERRDQDVLGELIGLLASRGALLERVGERCREAWVVGADIGGDVLERVSRSAWVWAQPATTPEARYSS